MNRLFSQQSLIVLHHNILLIADLFRPILLPQRYLSDCAANAQQKQNKCAANAQQMRSKCAANAQQMRSDSIISCANVLVCVVLCPIASYFCCLIFPRVVFG
jgi:hypothetical protein